MAEIVGKNGANGPTITLWFNCPVDKASLYVNGRFSSTTRLNKKTKN